MYFSAVATMEKNDGRFLVEGRNVLHHAVLSDDAETVLGGESWVELHPSPKGLTMLGLGHLHLENRYI